MSTGLEPVLISFCGGDDMKVTIPEITDQELAGLLKSSGMTEDEVKAFLKRCENNCCCAEKVRILRKTRKSLLDSIHEKQAVLDKLDNLIWCTEHGGVS
jgi:hypothetical protein